MYHDKTSPYFLGRYWPPEAPEVFFKQVKLKPQYEKFTFDPAYRLPLFPLALGDSVIATHQWGFPSRKFSDEWQTVRLTELLYGVPPLEHVSGQTLSKWLKDFVPYYKVFTRLHRAIAFTGMTAFEWLTPDRLVQKSTFGNQARVTVNFSETPWRNLPARSAQIDISGAGPPVIYSW
jgi:hypothetical protein